jgi:hypothetical protein
MPVQKYSGRCSNIYFNSDVKDIEKRKIVCGPKGEGGGCEKSDGSIWPPTILFVANFVAGMGGSLYYTLGVSYMDDNIQKAKTPALISKYLPPLIIYPSNTVYQPVVY